MFSKTVKAALILAATATGANAMTLTQDGHTYTVQIPETVTEQLSNTVEFVVASNNGNLKSLAAGLMSAMVVASADAHTFERDGHVYTVQIPETGTERLSNTVKFVVASNNGDHCVRR